MAVQAPAVRRAPGAWFRVLCGIYTLCLALLCVVSCWPYLMADIGSLKSTIWVFFVWGLALVAIAIWLIRGRSKGREIIVVRERKRILTTLGLTVMVVAVAILSAGFTVEEGDIFDRSMGYRTMFACLFGTLPFLLFGTEADLEPKQSRPLDAVGRRKLKPRIAVLFVLGVLALLVSLVPGELVYPWLQKLLLSVGIATLILCVELGYRLWTSRPSGSGGNDPAISHGND